MVEMFFTWSKEVTGTWQNSEMTSQRGQSSGIRFDRLFVPKIDVWSPKWPEDIKRLRRLLPPHLIDASPSRLSEKGNWFVIASASSIPIGYAWSVRSLIDLEAYVEEVAVHPEHRRHGLGGQLVIEAATWMGQDGFNSISILPITSETWVKRLGMEKSEFGGYRALISALRVKDI